MQERDPKIISSAIRSQLRSITRLVWDLRKSISWVESIDRDPPNLIVPLEPGAMWDGAGLKLGGLKSLSVPNERIIDDGYELAGHVYTLKDRFHMLAKVTNHPMSKKNHPQNVNKIVNASFDLQICGDLTNLKKHGRNHNLSKSNPTIGNVIYDTSKCGPIEVKYDGGSKATALLISNPVSITYRIEVMSNSEKWTDNILHFATRAVEQWKPLIITLGVIEGDDRECEFIKQIYDFE